MIKLFGHYMSYRYIIFAAMKIIFNHVIPPPQDAATSFPEMDSVEIID